MLKVADIFFSLLRSALWGENVQVPDGFKDWGPVFAMAKSQSVLGLVAHAVLDDPTLSGAMPDAVRMKLKPYMMANVASHNLLNNTVAGGFAA